MASDWSQSEPLTAATFTSFTTRLASKQRLLQLQQQQQTDKNYRCMHTNCLSVRHGRNMSLDDMVGEHAPFCCCPVADSELVLLINHGTGEGLILARGFVCSWFPLDPMIHFLPSSCLTILCQLGVVLCRRKVSLWQLWQPGVLCKALCCCKLPFGASPSFMLIFFFVWFKGFCSYLAVNWASCWE